VLALALLVALVAALLAALGAAVAHVLRGLDAGRAVAPSVPGAPAATVARLADRRAAPPADPAPGPPVLPSLPVGFRYDAVTPGPLQLVDDDAPSTKVCPDCAETVVASARVCKHCRYRFAPPLHGPDGARGTFAAR